MPGRLPVPGHRPEPPMSTPQEKGAAGAEFIALHTRVIALENLVIAILAAGSEHHGTWRARWQPT
jgi:hypothetical protein